MSRLPRGTDYDTELLKLQRRIRKLEKTVKTLVERIEQEVCQCRN